jgi:uncharacterized protein (TIGR02391 family)
MTHWDNIRLLQAVDRHQEQFGGGPVWSVDGRLLMEELAGGQVADDNLSRGFIRELDIAASEGYLTFDVENYSGNAQQLRQSYPYQYLQQVRNFALTVKGQDRARGIRVLQPLSNPDEDDGRQISGLILQQIGSAIAAEYTTPHQILVFLREAGIPLDRLALDEEPPDIRTNRADFVYAMLVGLEMWGSEGRRILRSFVGAWLDDRMISGPADDLRRTLVEQLARQGWYVDTEGNLVIGEPTRGKRTRSPVLRDARLAVLHPQVLQVSEDLFRDGHKAAAVFEAAKAINNRVKAMTGLNGDGSGMMGNAFKDEQPPLVLADLATQSGKDTQSGYRFLFMGSQLAIRNPPAHEPFGEMTDDEAFELLGLASHLMRKLDEVGQSGS